MDEDTPQLPCVLSHEMLDIHLVLLVPRERTMKFSQRPVLGIPFPFLPIQVILRPMPTPEIEYRLPNTHTCLLCSVELCCGVLWLRGYLNYLAQLNIFVLAKTP